MIASNPCIATLEVDSIYLSRGEVYNLNLSEFSLEPNFTQEIWLTFTPSAAGVYLDTINIVSNDPYWQDKLLQIPVSAIGIAEKLTDQYTPDPFTMALYHLNDGKGLIATDTTAFMNHAALQNETAWSDTARFGSHAIAVNRSWLYANDNPLANASSSQFTAEFWFYPENHSRF